MPALLLAIAFLLFGTAYLKAPPFLVLLFTVLGYGLLAGLPLAAVLTQVRTGFGGLIGAVGLLIVLGSLIGVALERSGAAGRIAEALLGGGQLPVLRLVVLGAIVSVPVFCDSGFILLAGLLPAIARRSGRPLGTLALGLAGGLYLTHTLIPPTPGPLAAAANLGAEAHVGTIMLLGMAVSVPVLLLVWYAAGRLGGRVEARPPARPTDDEQTAPSLGLSLLPLLLPVVLIALNTLLNQVDSSARIANLIAGAGDPTVALLLGSLAALYLLPRDTIGAGVSEALTLAGPILIITGLGGAFGAVVKASALVDDLNGWIGDGNLGTQGLLLTAFGLAALLKTAQGSSTGALVITSGLLAPVLPLAGITDPVGLALVTLAVGGGAMTVSHANDSYFWVVTRFAGIAVPDAYRSYTVLTGLMGLGVLVMVLLLSYLR